MNASQSKVLRLLADAGNRGVTTGEMVRLGAGNRFSARILELRELGYEIEAKRERQSSFRYTLLDSESSAGTSSPIPPDPGVDAEALHPASTALSAERLFEDEQVFACRSHWIEE